jgi:hypothetical protein
MKTNQYHDLLERINILEDDIDIVQDRHNNLIIFLKLALIVIVFGIFMWYAINSIVENNKKLENMIANPPDDIKSYCIGKATYYIQDRMSHKSLTGDVLQDGVDFETIYDGCVKSLVQLELRK